MKNLKALRTEGSNSIDEAKDYHAAAISASEHAKKQPSATTHKAASDAHEKAISWHERKINALIKKDGSSEEVKKHEQHIKMHKNEAQKHRFNAHRLSKAQQNEGLEDACWKGYEAIGTKEKNGKTVPNCVPKEGHAEDAQAAHQAAHAALKKDDIETYHKEMDKKFAAHQAAEKEAAKKPVKTYEATEFKPDEGRLNQIKKDHEELKNKSTKDVLAIHQRQHRVRSNYTAAEVGGKHAMIGDILRNRHGDKHVSHYFSVKEDTDEQKNLKITKHEKAALEAEKRGDKDAQKYHLDRVKSLKQESVNEAKDTKKQKHLVVVTVSDPQHTMSSMRNAKIMKRAKVSAESPQHAVKAAEKHYKKQGFKVHDSIHHSVLNESLDTDEFIDSYNPQESTDNDVQEVAMARGQFAEIADMANELVDAMEDTDELEPWMHSKITTAYVNLDDVYSYIAYGDKYSTDDDSKDNGDKNVSEATENGESEVDNDKTLSPEEKAQIARIQTLIRLGLLDRSQMQVTLRAIKKLDMDQPVVSSAERTAINDLVSKLIGVVTGDDTIFRKVKLSVQK